MNILLVCSAGMSTSLLVTKMEEAAVERGMKSKIWAVPADAIDEHIGEADVLLLGPQVRFMMAQMEEKASAKEIPVDVIDMRSYGLMDGKAVVEQAVQLAKGAE